MLAASGRRGASIEALRTAGHGSGFEIRTGRLVVGLGAWEYGVGRGLSVCGGIPWGEGAGLLGLGFGA